MNNNLVLTTEAMRVVNRNDKGNVTYRKRYRRGDVVDTSYLDDARVEYLKSTGALVPQDEFNAPEPSPYDDFPAWAGKDRPDDWDSFSDEEKREYVYGDDEEGSGGSGTPDGSEGSGGASGEAAEGSTPSSATVRPEGTEGEPIPDLDNMSYQDLRALAAEKNLDTSGNTEALVNRLTEYYTS